MLLAQINQSADFQHEGDAQEVTLCLTETVGIADCDQGMDTVSLQAVTLADGSTAYIPHNTQDSNIVEGQVIQLEDGSSAYVQHIAVPKADESNNWTGSSVCDVVGNESLRLEDAQTVQLEDGTTAYIHHTGKALADTYEPNTLQAVQLEDGSTAYIHHAVQMSQPNTILAIQTNGTVADLHTDAAIDQETINALEQYTTKIEEIDSYADSELITSDPHSVVEMQIVLQGQGIRRNAQQPGEKCFRCNYDGCGKLYTTANHLKVHERVHTGDKPYCCDLPGCGKRFATGYGLKSHIRTHTGEKPYRCQEMDCKKSFKTSGDLQKHTRIHTGEKPFLCPFPGCGRSFTTSNICKVHVRTHTGEKPYHCTEPGCNRAFASATNYKNHIRIHTGERPYVCTVPGCDKRFTEYSSLYKHNVVHTPCKPYKCNHCGKMYKQISTLVIHKRTAHNDSEPIEEESEGYFEPPSEAIDDPSLTVSPVKCEDTCPEMDSEISDVTEQQHVTLITQDGASQAIGSVITMLTQDGSVITIPPTESLLSSAEAHSVTVVSEDGTEGQMTAMMPEFTSSRNIQDEFSAHPITLLATSNGTQIAVQLNEQTSLEEALRIASSLQGSETTEMSN
ncbi:zinc finger protein 143-like isoform X1 [Cyprinus carpio]|uniref:Zinc finger protein 143-like isoform X1 n=1 Tax=Cyprinus carpio TaxID=7962 RepID=A0A9Q9YB81_CYPCA|nr:zinc finger protein 143-like isoform X1 [Cyprinus carpio]